MKKSILIMFVGLIFFWIFKQSYGQTVINMEKKGGVYLVPCTLNGLKLKFIFDTGADHVSISMTEALYMLKNGYLKMEDIIGEEYYQVATGDIEVGTKIIIREIEFAGLKLYNVEASVVHELFAPLLLGQSVISKLGKIQIDPAKNTLTIMVGGKEHSGYSQENMKAKEKIKMGEMKMEMYKSAEIDGCTDFHCFKCSDRNACSRGEHCNMQDCGHKHGAILCHGGILFYIRSAQGFTDDAGNPSCVTRAEFVANQLNMLLGMMESHENCYFSVLDENKNEINNSKQIITIWFAMEGMNPHKVISISSSDLAGYKYRADLQDLKNMATPSNKLTKKLVAQWWAYNLKDHFTMMVLNEKPYLTTYTHCGKVLLIMWEEARLLVPSGKIPMHIWNKVVENLSTEEKAHLYFAAQIIPMNFNPNKR